MSAITYLNKIFKTLRYILFNYLEKNIIIFSVVYTRKRDKNNL
jgi:hypothetical protein